MVRFRRRSDTRRPVKLREALLVARGHRLDSLEAIDNFLAKELPFSISGTYGGNSSCVEIEAGGNENQYVLCDLGSGVRESETRCSQSMGREEIALQCFPVAHALGSHHGVPVFYSIVHPEQRDPD